MFQMGKKLRQGEGPAYADALRQWGIPILGYISGAATAEAGDMVWLDSRTSLSAADFARTPRESRPSWRSCVRSGSRC